MKILKTATTTLFLAVLCLFIWFCLNEKTHSDATIPSIEVDTPLIEISIHDDTQKLLTGVTAFDGKDGDLTSRVIVESVSQFSDDKTCTVTYVVADTDKHVAKNTRRICYIDYTSPRFTLNQALVFPVGSNPDIQNMIGAVDCMEGDISDRVILTASDYQANTTGVFHLSVQVGNQKGDVIYLELPLYAEEQNVRAPLIELTDYLIYVPVGATPDFASYVASIQSNYSKVNEAELLISEDFQPETPGVYSIHYYIPDSLGNEGHTVLTVVVEE